MLTLLSGSNGLEKGCTAQVLQQKGLCMKVEHESSGQALVHLPSLRSYAWTLTSVTSVHMRVQYPSSEPMYITINCVCSLLQTMHASTFLKYVSLYTDLAVNSLGGIGSCQGAPTIAVLDL